MGDVARLGMAGLSASRPSLMLNTMKTRGIVRDHVGQDQLRAARCTVHRWDSDCSHLPGPYPILAVETLAKLCRV